MEELDLVLAHYAITWAQMWPPEAPPEWENWELKWNMGTEEET